MSMHEPDDPIEDETLEIFDEDLDDGGADGTPRQEPTERISRLVQFLLANECTRSDIFERMADYYKIDPSKLLEGPLPRSVDKKFERDLKFLENQGFEIKKVRAKGQPIRYSLVKGSGPATPFLFTQPDVDNLSLLYNLFADPTRYTHVDPSLPLPLQPAHNPFAEEMLVLIEKLVHTLPAEQKKRFDRWVKKPYIYFNISPVADYLPYRATIDTIIRAISARRQIQFEYTPTHHKHYIKSHRDIDPYYIIFMEGHFYLIGYSHGGGYFLEYRIDRIKFESLKIQPGMIDTERRRKPIEFTFWIDSALATRGLSQRWLTQTLEREEAVTDEQGRTYHRTLIRATAYNEWRVIQQILRYGEKAELVEPAYLRERMIRTIERMALQYHNK